MRSMSARWASLRCGGEGAPVVGLDESLVELACEVCPPLGGRHQVVGGEAAASVLDGSGGVGLGGVQAVPAGLSTARRHEPARTTVVGRGARGEGRPDSPARAWR